METKKNEMPIKISIKELELELSKEQALRTGIVKFLFNERREYTPDLENKELFPSDCNGIRIAFKELHITSY